MNKLSKKSQQFLAKMKLPKAQAGAFTSTAFPYVMQPALNFAQQVAPIKNMANQVVAGLPTDPTNMAPGAPLTLGQNLTLTPGVQANATPQVQQEPSNTQQGFDALDAAGLASPVAKIAMGLYNFSKGQQEKAVAKANEKMFKQDYMDRKEKMRDMFYTTPYTVGRSSDFTAQNGRIVLAQDGGMSAFQDFYNSQQAGNAQKLDMFKDVYKQTVYAQNQQAKMLKQQGLGQIAGGIGGIKDMAIQAAKTMAGVPPMQEGGKIQRTDLLDYSMKMQQGGSILDSIWNATSKAVDFFSTPSSYYIDQQENIELDKPKEIKIDYGEKARQIDEAIKQISYEAKAAITDDDRPRVQRPPKFNERFREHQLGGEIYELIEAKNGYKVERSNQRKGKTHKVTGPDGTVKFFGDSKLGQHPNDPDRKKAFYARHKENLKNNPYFRAFARKTWQDGGEIEPNLYDQDFQGVDNSDSKMDAILAEQELMQQDNFFDEAVNQYAVQRNEDNLYNGQPTSGNSEALNNSTNVIDRIAYNESRGRYDVVNEQTKTVGKYQFMQKYWADPIRKFMKLPPSMPDEFVMESFKNSPASQDRFMQHVVQNIYMPEVEKIRPLAQQYGLTDDDVIRLMHYRGVGEAKTMIQTGNFEVSKEEQKKYKNPTVQEYLGKPINR